MIKLVNQKLHNDFCVGQDENTKEYILAIFVFYDYWYFRYYHITKEEYDWFETDIKKLDTLAKICYQEIFNSRFICSENKRDYLDNTCPAITFYNGVYCSVCIENNKTYLKPTGGPSPKADQLGFKNIQTSEYKLEIQTNICFICDHITYFNDSHISVGTKYEIKCPKCGYISMRKKV